MLDISRLERIHLTRYPRLQRWVGYLLALNYNALPGVRVEFENADRLPDEPVIFAMNHTDRFNYFPFQYKLWRLFDRFTATWVKGKYYENPAVAKFLENTNQLPTVSRGYLITKDFVSAMGRSPSNEEYEVIRKWVDSQGRDLAALRPDIDKLPEKLLTTKRDVLGYEFDPAKEDYAGYLDSLFHIMMRRFVEANRLVPKTGLDLLIFPQGTRSVRLLDGHIGIAEIALHLKVPIVPVGCNGSDEAFPGSSPWAKKAHIVYRFGHPMRYEDLAAFHVAEAFEPFSADAEQRHHDRFQALADRITDEIEGLLDERHRRGQDTHEEAQIADRFI